MKKRKRTLNQTWTLCLWMWRWIVKVWQTPRYRRYDVNKLKRIWLRKNGFNINEIYDTCFFCDYGIGSCSKCPGKLVDSGFRCYDDKYCYSEKPIEFYKELLRLNRIRKAKK